MLEQPCRTLEACAAVHAATGLAMKIDENAHDTASLLRAFDLGCMDAVALKLSKFGGLSALRKARDLCLHLGAKMGIEDTWGSDIATAAALHLAAASPPEAVLNVCDLSGYVTPRLAPDAPSRQNGVITPPEGPGLGSGSTRGASARRSRYLLRRASMETAQSPTWTERAAQVLPAGGFGNFDPNIVVREGRGARVLDENGNEFIDYLIGSGPMLLGHGHPEVVEAVQEQAEKGMTFFASNAAGIELAEVICDAVACADQLRYVSTGGEADMYAIRLARAHTGRDKIVKFEGGYHGMSAESLMSLAPTRLENFPLAVPDSAGIPENVRDLMLIAPFNDADFVRGLLDEHAGEIAAVIVEPLQRLVPPAPGFLEALREETEKHGIVLIFDEVVTGFRLAYGGAQERYGVVPDLCTLGKVIGGGLPLAAVVGKAGIMAHFDKEKAGEGGFTYQVGTLSGNPLAAAAGLKTLEILRRDGAYEQLRQNGETVMAALEEHLSEAAVPHRIVGDPVLFDVVFTSDPVIDYRGCLRGDAGLANRFNDGLRDRGILKPPSKFYISLGLNEEDLAETGHAIADVASTLADG